MTEARSGWSWEELDPSRSATSGDLGKIFKNERAREPSLLSRNAPSQTATLLAREVIQNSWDAARELRASVDADADEPFAICFGFRSLTGSQRASFVDTLDLHQLKERSDGLDRRSLGLGEHDVLTHLHAAQELPVLVIEEAGASGMYGPWSTVDSKLYLALLSHGFTVKGSGSGGSHGYGKAGLITGSLTRTVVAYTCFRERPDDPGVTRRLMAVTYWGPHEWEGRRFSGFGRLGAPGSEGVPFENDEADAIARGLGLSVRSPAVFEQLGTSFVVIDPSLGAGELVEAVERNWWPAILEGSFDVDILTESESLVPRPRSNESLRPFIRGWELATSPQDNAVDHEWARRLNVLGMPSGRKVESGRIGLVADPNGWSFPLMLAGGGVDDEVEHRSLVALVRGPRMVVEYLDAGRAAPFVRGTFVAADDIDELLRQTEPKAHDRWETDPSNLGVDPDAPFVARSILDRVRRNVRDFRDRLRPAATPRREIQLTELDRLMTAVLEGPARTINRAPARSLIEVRLLDQVVEPIDEEGSTIRLRARLGVRIDPTADLDDARVDVSVRARIHEDGRNGSPFEMSVGAPEGYSEPEQGRFSGPVSSAWSIFELETQPYRSDWTCRFSADAKIAAAPSGVGV